MKKLRDAEESVDDHSANVWLYARAQDRACLAIQFLSSHTLTVFSEEDLCSVILTDRRTSICLFSVSYISSKEFFKPFVYLHGDDRVSWERNIGKSMEDKDHKI